MTLYTLTKLPNGPRKEGPVSQSLESQAPPGWICGRGDVRPAVGEQLMVGAFFRIDPDVPGLRITSPVARIVSDQPGCVVFETESGSLYEWTCSELH